MEKKSITSNYIYNLLYQLVIILIPLFTTPYLTRVLGATKLGIYSYTYSIVTVFFLLSSLGINTYGQREIAYVQDDKEKRSKIFWELVIIRIITTIISLILLFCFSYMTSKYSIYYKIFSIYVFANLFDITWLYQGMENFKGVAVRNLIVKLFYIVAIFAFVKTSKDLYIYILLFSILTLITNLSFWLGLKKTVFIYNFKKINLKKHFISIIGLFIPQVAALVYSVLDKTMIGIMVPKISNVSFYEQASYIVKTTLMLVTTAGTVMASRMAYSFKKKDTKLMKGYMDEIIKFVWLFGCALVFGVCGVIQNFVPWFYGFEYHSVINLVYVTSPLIIIIGLNNVLGTQYLVPTNQQKKYILAVVIGAIANFVMNLILINILGTIGAAIASVISELLILTIEIILMKDVMDFKKIIAPAFKYIIFGLIMLTGVYFSGNIFGSTIYGTFLQVVIGIIIYISLLILTKDEFVYIHVFSYIKNIIKLKLPNH